MISVRPEASANGSNLDKVDGIGRLASALPLIAIQVDAIEWTATGILPPVRFGARQDGRHRRIA